MRKFRPAPDRPLVVSTASLSAVFDPSDGLPYQFLLGKERIWGEDSGFRMTAILCRLKPRSYVTTEITPTATKVSQSEVSFTSENNYQGQPATSFVLKYSLHDSALSLTMEQVVEHPGFELIEVPIPDLATVREEDGGVWLVHGNGGGALVDLNHAKPYRMPEDRFFGKIAHVLPVAMVGSDRVATVLEVSAFMDGMQLEIVGETGHRHARIGTVQTFRVHGGRPYEMNDLGPPISGNENTPNLLVGQMPRCRLDFFADAAGDRSVNWLDGAKIIRQVGACSDALFR